MCEHPTSPQFAAPPKLALREMSLVSPPARKPQRPGESLSRRVAEIDPGDDGSSVSDDTDDDTPCFFSESPPPPLLVGRRPQRLDIDVSPSEALVAARAMAENALSAGATGEVATQALADVARILARALVSRCDEENNKKFVASAASRSESNDKAASDKTFSDESSSAAALTSPTVPRTSPTAPRESWLEAVDPASGATYYHNTATGETTWTKPSDDDDDDDEADGEWVEATDPSGRPYYANRRTGAVSWTKPTTTSASTTSTASPTGVDSWSERCDPSTGVTYYINAFTGESSWTRPSTAAAIETSWIPAVDPASGATYYTHAGTGETTWIPR
ncbi:hypothetical protein CTAYLR_005744 [Chrysophaeum taylorii]|uniref:WW domain-containing protein n=1 Tax=Chrysophaeum taylorii TaxID=2483200 RepID=A0AAD7XL46_9STRA|nr:hypothetical protein CTAYLR_005744 [Chrysophaeum taylorii]